ncbi:MAG: formylmethanofuran-tetrahydromethanopterin formyltransferase [Candidatus Syntrophoarchaeum caldarius]|uniref:Formylmethanofuran--tetrahydromethanopterin formyltransferase n=1 Tax=Candidatus Syntropharchaeum caldarium TaxID=1838285 RepID=A0A1F2P8T5_9EURY|nr:MAG: formylmethanofuran-tetrahydromethanopterin formyltransferase [Candidatus Syntrophoarchaeum caldarius]
MEINGVEIEDTYAEAFGIKIARVLITAASEKWVLNAAREATGFGTSVIGCPAECGIERMVDGSETPDGRPGAYIQICTFGYKSLEEQLLERIGQCVLTSATARAFNGLPDAEKQFNTGFKLKFFADGFERVDEIDGRKMFFIPMMQGEFGVEENIGAVAGVAGGNFFILGKTQEKALAAAEAAVDAIMELEGSITPFPGGIVASGSKPGSNKYSFLKASTNEKFCPTLKDKVEGSIVPPDVDAIFELVINGLDVDAVKLATKKGIEAATACDGIVKITAGNYGGDLGEYKINLHELF